MTKEWFKSTFSGPNSDMCVEVRVHLNGSGVSMRNSKNPDGARLTYTTQEWEAFVQGVKAGEFDF